MGTSVQYDMAEIWTVVAEFELHATLPLLALSRDPERVGPISTWFLLCCCTSQLGLEVWFDIEI